jgi:nucleoid DNA-binding protein
MSSEEDGAKLADFLASFHDDEYLYLPGVGWLTVKRYAAYEGSSPRSGEALNVPKKRIPFFNADPELLRALDGVPTENKTFANELDRYFDALHPAHDAHADPELHESFTVVRFQWSDEIANEIRRELVASGRAEVPILGVFEVVEKPGRPGVNPDNGEPILVPPRKIVRLTTSPEMRAILAQEVAPRR